MRTFFASLKPIYCTTFVGRQQLEELDRLGVEKSGPAFYRLMARLEESGLVEGWYESEIAEGGASLA